MGGRPRDHREGVAAEGPTGEHPVVLLVMLLPFEALHDVGPACHRTDRQAPSQGLAVGGQIGHHPELLLGAAVGQAEPGDHLVEQEQDTRVPAGGGQLADELAAVEGVANASMIRAIKSVSVQRGRDPRDFTLIAFGGSGPVHAVGIARELGIKRVVVPPRPGVFSAVGLLEARLEFHAKKTFLRRTRCLSRHEIRAEIEELEAKAREGVGRTSLQTVSFEAEPWVEMRYVGQAFELPVKLPPFGDDWSSWLLELDRAFGEQHLNTYGHRTENPTEIVQLLVVIRESNPPGLPASNRAASLPGVPHERAVYFGEDTGLVPTPVIRRGDLTPTPWQAPLIVEDYDATTVVPPGYRVFRDGSWNVFIEEGST